MTSRIAAAYIGSMCKHMDMTLQCIAVNVLTNTVLLHSTHGRSYPVSVDKCQLILKPLSEISEADAIELVDTVLGIYSDYDRAWKVNCGRHAAKTMDHPYGHLRPDYSRHLIDFLRSRSYDCGHGSIPSLIDANLAININSNKE